MSAPPRTLHERWRSRHAASGGRALRELAELVGPRPPVAAPLRIALLGCFNAGKSTLVSALLQEQVAETYALPTSRCVTVFGYAPCPSVRISRHGKIVHELRWAARDDWERRWFGGEALAGALPRAWELAGSAVRIGLPHPLLRAGIELLDTPGHDAMDEADTAEALAALESADAALYLCPRRHVLSAADLPVIDAIAARARPWALVVTHLGPWGDDPDVREELTTHAHTVSRRWGMSPTVLWAPDPDEPVEEASRSRRADLVAHLERWRRALVPQRRS
jgi:hypothetical protein